MRREGGARAGVSLIEVVVALAIFATALFALVRCLGRVVEASRVNGEYETAATLARWKLAEIELDGPSLYENDSGDFEVGLGEFSWESEAVELTVGDLYEVTVTVKWQSAGGMRSAEFSTFIYDGL